MRGPVVVAAGAVVLAAAGLGYVLLRPTPPSAPPVAPSPVVAAPRAETPPAVAAPPPAATETRRVVPKPAPAEAPVAAPVEAAPTTGSLRIETDVEGATVFLDRVGVGTAPMTIPNITPGSHRLNVSASGYDGYAETLEIEPGPRTISINFKEIKLDVRIAAVHKHGVGSCRGQLFASPQGLRYEAADGKDSTTVAFADVGSFDVDYLAKNLRVRTRQGRTLNFTDPDGNADKLFAFHDEVEKVRKRVISQR